MKCPKCGCEMKEEYREGLSGKIHGTLLICWKCGHEGKLKDGEKR